MKKHKEKIKGSIKDNIRLMSTPLMSILPGQISFFVVLSIIPLISLLIMFASKLSLSFDAITGFITHYLPIGVSNLIITIFEEQKVGTLDILFIVTAFYIAAKATHSIIVASTQIYNGKQKDFISTRIKAIIMLMLLIFIGLLAISVMTVGSRFFRYLMTEYGAISRFTYTVYNILKWPFVLFVIFMAVKVLYTIAPNVKIPSRSVNKGAMLTTAIWTITTMIYSFYVTHLANYTKFYGNFTNLIILMIWIYWMCYIFVFGMTFNEAKMNGLQEDRQ